MIDAGISLFAADPSISAPPANIVEAPGNSSAELAKKLSNPLSDLIIVPLENNFDFGGGPKDDGFRYTLKVQPVMPISLNEHWNLISRTILPFIDQHDMIGTTHQSGLGDTLQSIFFSPKEPTRDNWIWGAGPVFLLPTATDDLLDAENSPSGRRPWCSDRPTAGLMACSPTTSGQLRATATATYLQPILDYTTKYHTTLGIGSESSYDWKQRKWTVPFIVNFSQLVKIGKLPIDLKLSGKYYAEAPNGAPDWGLRFTITFLFPRPSKHEGGGK